MKTDGTEGDPSANIKSCPDAPARFSRVNDVNKSPGFNFNAPYVGGPSPPSVN
jgi:hypothetical protein